MSFHMKVEDEDRSGKPVWRATYYDDTLERE